MLVQELAVVVGQVAVRMAVVLVLQMAVLVQEAVLLAVVGQSLLHLL